MDYRAKRLARPGNRLPRFSIESHVDSPASLRIFFMEDQGALIQFRNGKQKLPEFQVLRR